MNRPLAGERWLVVAAALASFLFLAAVPASVALRETPTLSAKLPASSLPRPASLRVTVRSAAGTVAFATVRVFWASGRRYYQAGAALTDAGGRATMAALPEGAAWILVDAVGLARRSTAVVLHAGTEEASVALEPARVVKIHVEDERGRPVPDATVLLTGTDALPFGALTGEDGGAAFDRVAESPWTLKVAARGYGTEERSGVAGDTTVTLRRASVLDVAVVDRERKAVTGAAVFVAGPGLWPARRVDTDGTGHARIAGLDTGAYDLKAQKGDLVSRTEIGFRIERGNDEALSLVLEQGRNIPILVTDGDGDHPGVVPNADVVLVEGGLSSFPLQGRTGTFGQVTLGPVAPGPLVAAARADGFVARGAVAIPENPGGEVRIALVRGATLRGEVVDGDGRAVDGASIEVVGTDQDGMPIAATPQASDFQRAHFAWALGGPAPLVPAGELGVTLGPVPPIPNGALAAAEFVSPVEALLTTPVTTDPWVTGTDGRFRATPVPPGRVRALVRHPAYVEATSDVVALGPGGTAEVKVVLRAGGSLQGTIVDDHGLPVAGARLEVAAVQGSLNRAVTSADDGTFAFGALPPDVTLSAARPEDPFHPVVRKRLTVPDGQKIELELALPGPRAAMEVSVEDASGRPVKMAQVTALSLDPERPLRTTAFSDDGGRAAIADAATLPLRVVVEAPGFARFTRQFDAAPEKLVAELGVGVPVEGRVTAVRGRADVSGAAVELLASGQRRSALTDARGRYHFDDVTPGSVHLSVSHPDYAPVELDAVVESTGRADRAFEVSPVDLEEPGIVEGTVVDRGGHPVAGARVAIGSVAAVLPAGPLAAAVTTKEDGSFRLERVRPGKRDVEAYSPGVGRGRATGVIVDTNRATSNVTVRLEAPDEPEPTATGGVAVTLGGPGGALAIAQVSPGSEAERAGLVAGDVVESIDGVHTTTASDARARLAGPEGADVVISVARGAEHVALRVRREKVRR